MVLSGCCEYCGQTQTIDVPDGNLTPAEIDALVTDQCNCPDAKSAKRKAETAKKIEDYINSQVDPEAREMIRAAVDCVKQYGADSVTIKANDGWNIKVHMDKDGYLCFDCKKTSSKKDKF